MSTNMENVLYELMKDNIWKTVHEKTMENSCATKKTI